jgi:hypothetical protein
VFPVRYELNLCMSRQCGILNISQAYRIPWPVTGIVLLYFFYFYVEESRPPLLSSSQSSWLQIRRPGYDSRRYQISEK